MSWAENAVFYHIYPLGLCGAPERNEYGAPVPRLRTLYPWITHLRAIGCTALYIGPLFESVGHGYETTDYRKLDSRLGDNSDLRAFVEHCHTEGVRVVLDAVFNHTGRDFFAFRDLLQNREQSRYRDWYCSVNFGGNNEYGDGFSYGNWGGFNLLPKLNLRNPELRDYLLDTVRFWKTEFGIDGLRLDAADVLDFDFMRALRRTAEDLGEDFWLMGEVIHGEYSRWVSRDLLHAVTDYPLHKALYSGHNDHNYFEIAHTVQRLNNMGLGSAGLYNFADNHDVERICTKLRTKAHYLPVHVLLYALPGIPSIYYGSEFGIEGRKTPGSDAGLRPCLKLEELQNPENPCRELVTALGRLYAQEPALHCGDYRELQLTTTRFAFARGDLIITVNNDANPAAFDLPGEGSYHGALSGKDAVTENGRFRPEIPGNSGEIWIPQGRERAACEPLKQKLPQAQAAPRSTRPTRAAQPKPWEEMSVPELQAEILAKLAANGPVTARMEQDVLENVYRDSLLNWIRSFR